MKRIEIVVPYVSTSQYGELYAGDIVSNCNDELAAHLVDEARAAKYLEVKAEPKVEPKSEVKPEKRKG